MRAAGQWRAPRTFDARVGLEASRAPWPARPGTAPTRPVVSFASNDYLGLTHHPAVIAAAHDAIDRWGTGSGAARLIVGSRPVHDEFEARARPQWKHTERAVLFATGFAANLGVLATFAGPDVLVCSDELNHASLVDGRRLAGAPLAVYRHCDAAHVDALLRARDAPSARSWSPSRCSRWTATSRRSTTSSRSAPATARCSWSTRPTRCSAPIPTVAFDGRRAARRHAVQDPRRARWLRRRPAAVHRSAREPRPLLHLHHRVHPGRQRRGARRDRRGALGRRRRAPRPAARRTSTACAPGHPSPIIPYVCGSEDARARRRRRAARRRDARHRDPAADGAAGHVAPARARSPPHTTTRSSTSSSPRCAGVFPTRHGRERAPAAARAGHRHRDRDRQDVVRRGHRRRRCAPRGSHVAARKPVQSGEPGPATDAELLAAATGERPGTRVPAAPHLRRRLGAAHGRRRARARRPSRSPTSPPRSPGNRAPTSDWSRGSAGRARRSRPTATPSTSPTRSTPTSWCWSPMPGLGTVNAVRLSAGAFAGRPLVVALNRFGADPLHERNLHHLTVVDRFDVVTSPAELAARLVDATRQLLMPPATEARPATTALVGAALVVSVAPRSLAIAGAFDDAALPADVARDASRWRPSSPSACVPAWREALTMRIVAVDGGGAHGGSRRPAVARIPRPLVVRDGRSHRVAVRSRAPTCTRPRTIPTTCSSTSSAADGAPPVRCTDRCSPGSRRRITGVTGTNELATRLAFQVLAAVAVSLAAWLVAPRTRDPFAVLLIGVNPVVAMEIVNPGRNDALVGLALARSGSCCCGARRTAVASCVDPRGAREGRSPCSRSVRCCSGSPGGCGGLRRARAPALLAAAVARRVLRCSSAA